MISLVTSILLYRYKIKESGKNGFFSCENTLRTHSLDSINVYRVVPPSLVLTYL